MPPVYNASWTITTTRMKRVNRFMPITKNVENERIVPRDLSGNNLFNVKRVVWLFAIALVFDPRSDPYRQFACLAFVAPISSSPQFIHPTSSITANFVSTFVDDSSNANNSLESYGKSQELGLLTFDLDDTLFPIHEAVMDANARQLAYMDQILASKDCKLAFNMTVHQFQQTMYDVRRDLLEPFSYTDLRKLTIRRIFLEAKCLQNADSDEVDRHVENVFAEWLQERHLAAERYLFSDALGTLRELKNIYPDICIAAITNGRGDPLRMVSSLAPYFDFCISGEDDNVFPHRKPSPRIFELALQRYQQLYPHHNSLSERAWCHVGDCLVNDVGASAACGAFAIWFCPKETSDGDSGKDSKPLPKRIQKKLAVRVATLAELPAAIEELLQQKVDGSSNY